MKPTWTRVSTTIYGDSHDPGTVSIFFDYDLRCWLFGVSSDLDPSWYDFKISIGPIGLSFMYWRTYVALLD